jgi:hypothetical protein
MVVSGMGSGWISSFAIVKPGDSVVIDYTLYDTSGSPVVTTDQQLFRQAASEGGGIVYSRQITMTANQTLLKSIYPIPIYSVGGGWGQQFVLFAPEYELISSKLVGMKLNEKKRVDIPSNGTMTQLWTKEQLKRNGVNMSTINVGDVLAMAVSDNPEEMATNISAVTYVRIAEIASKTPQGVVVDFGYPAADIAVYSINNKR